MGNAIVKAFKPEVTPGPYQEPSFDTMYGFPEGRKERGLSFSFTLCHHHTSFTSIYIYFLVMIATEDEMMSAKLPLENRDYCAHLALKILQCRKEVWPWAYKCTPEKHEYLNCEYEE